MARRLHEPNEPIDERARRERRIPSRFVTWGDYWPYMRAAVAKSRNLRRGGARAAVIADDGSAEYAADSRARSITAIRRRHRPGYCALCGHEYPLDTCPICADELAGLHAEPGPVWEALIRVIA